MLHAVIRGKLRVSHAAEDALTATAFGLLSAMPWSGGLAAWLRTATCFANGSALVLPMDEPTFMLWPSFRVDADRDCEPDVVLEWADGTRVLFECKLDSPPSGDPSDGGAITGQLGRQWLAARKAGKGPLALVYVTKHWTPPLDLLRSHIEEVERKASDSSMRTALFWLPWRTLVHVLHKHGAPDATAARLAMQVSLYLRSLDLACFHGFHNAAGQLPTPWSYERRRG